LLVGDLTSKLKASTVVVYLYLLHQSAVQRKTILNLHTGHVLFGANIGNDTLKQAREELMKHNLVRSKELPKRGHWEYELLDPRNGGSLPSRKNVNFAELSNWVVEQFYLRLMPDRAISADRFDCPLQFHSKPSFSVHYDRGADGHGTWSCRACNSNGGMVSFYRKLKDVNTGEAMRAVRALLHSLIEEERMRAQQVRTTPAVTPENSLLHLI
jgi:hypothetical protein